MTTDTMSPKNSGASPDGTQTQKREAPKSGESRISRIARRAHEIYEARGGEHGKAIDDWLQAEREIDAEMDREREGG